MSSELVRRTGRGVSHIIWTPELVAALNAERQAGKTLRELSADYGISAAAIKTQVAKLPEGTHRRGLLLHPEQRESAPPIPPPPTLACGCYRGHPCERARELAAAMGRERWGSREWAIARFAWIRHQAGE
jgi:hypothetical protein